jgi:lipoyl synthase
MGETDEELLACMRDLRAAGVDTLTIGQYLQPSAQHLRLDRYVTPETFARFRAYGEDELGFAHVEAGPMVRSSYHAGQQAIDAQAWQASTHTVHPQASRDDGRWREVRARRAPAGLTATRRPQP